MTGGPLAHVTQLLRAALPAILAIFVLAFLAVSRGKAENPGGASVANRQVLPTTPAAPSRRRDEEKLGERLREGTKLIDVVGSFQVTGDRVSFHPDGTRGESFRVLENLALERIDRVLAESRLSPSWTVSGTITEFRGSNYLLVTKAVVRTAADGTPAP
ncbi:MAG: hypothetical protein MUF06_04140 [Pirellulaceae bacterium]|jgi:hypothetical protein|nr:hypothetical protein [Pirellulaceae bacterium]